MQVTPAGFAHLTHALMGLADGKVVLALEVKNGPSMLSGFFLKFNSIQLNILFFLQDLPLFPRRHNMLYN